jgi:hypothetical protein
VISRIKFAPQASRFKKLKQRDPDEKVPASKFEKKFYFFFSLDSRSALKRAIARSM